MLRWKINATTEQQVEDLAGQGREQLIKAVGVVLDHQLDGLASSDRLQIRIEVDGKHPDGESQGLL